MQSLQRWDLLPGAPRAVHSASKHAVKGLTKVEAPEAAGNQVAARIGYLAKRSPSCHVVELPGRKSVVWVTGSLPFSLAVAAKMLNRANLAVYPADARGLVGMPRQLTASAPTPNVRKPPITNFGPEGLQTMQEFADLTGGRAFYNTNDLSGAIRIALEDSAVTYTLGFIRRRTRWTESFMS